MSLDHEFFHYTRDRFIQNEAQRYIHFDVKKLAHVGAAAVGAKSCFNIKKYLNSICNKASLLTLDNGMQAVANIPNPNACLPHLTTASEVATMEFVCTYASHQLLSPC